MSYCNFKNCSMFSSRLLKVFNSNLKRCTNGKIWCLSSLWDSQTFRTPKRLMGINCQSALEWLLVWILLCQLDVSSVCLPLISSIKHHKSNHLSSVSNNIFCRPFFSWWAIGCLFPGMSDPCCSQVDKFCKREGQSQCGVFVLTSPSLGCHSTAALILREPGAVILLTGFFPAALSLHQSHQLTHSLQNALELLREADCLPFVFSGKNRSESASIFVQ